MASDIRPAQPRPSALRRSVVALSLVAGGFILGAGTLAFASAGDGPWHGGFHHGPRIGFFQHIVRGALENVGATTAQEDKIHDIIATTYTGMEKDASSREAMRKQVLELMKAPTVDRGSVEKLRAQKIAEMDAKSKKVVDALVDAAGQLTQDQRTKLVANVEARMAHRGWGWGGWHHRGGMEGPEDRGGSKGHPAEGHEDHG